MLPDAGPMVAHPARRLSSVKPATRVSRVEIPCTGSG